MSTTDKARRIAKDSSAQRLLNLFFVFITATRPLTTEEILSDTDLGYGSAVRASDERKFRRDRQKLAAQGIHIAEITDGRWRECEQSSWQIDHERTFAAGGVIDIEDARTLAAAIEDFTAGMATPLTRPLRAIKTKALDLAATSSTHQQQDRGASMPTAAADPSLDALVDVVWSAFATRRKLTISYRNARGISSKRTVSIYGLITRDGITYFSGYDDARECIRTFRLDRIERAWRPKGSYEIPTWFNVHDCLFQSFDFGDDEPSDATFLLPAELTDSEVAALTYGRGHIEYGDSGERLWTVTVRDLAGAAAFALEHACEGVRPISPAALCARWTEAIDKAVSVHDAR